MDFLIVRSLSSILEASLWTYFIVSLAKILNKEDLNFSKKQVILLTLVIFICSIIGILTADIFPFLNALITWPLIFIFIIVILKVTWFRSLIIIAANSIILMITELIAVFTCMSIFKIDSDAFVNSWFYLSIALVIQYTILFAIIKISNIIPVKKAKIKLYFKIVLCFLFIISLTIVISSYSFNNFCK